MNEFTGEVLRSSAGGQETIFRDLNYLLGYMCQSYFWWYWIIIAILLGLLISVDMRLHDILKHVPKKVMNELYKQQSKKKRKSKKRRK